MIKDTASRDLFEILIVVFLILTAPTLSWAQPLRDTNPSDILVWQKGQEYTITSADDKSIIPDSVYFEAIFREILTVRPRYLSDADWDLIKGLPSHSTNEFTARKHEAFLAMCANLASIQSDYEIIIIATQFDAIQENSYAVMDEHYRQFLPKLSASTQALILAEKADYKNGSQFGFSKMDMVGLAADTPQVAKAFLKNGCAAVEHIGIVNLEDKRLLMSDERIPALMMYDTKNK